MAFDFSIKNLTKNFFRPELVLNKAERAYRKRLSKMGAFVRTRARSSIRRRKSISAPGSPPSAHAGQIKLIYFAFDPATQSVVIGPTVFGPKAAGLLEKGGTVRRTKRNGERRTLNYRPRPFMAPALEAEAPKFPDLLRGMIS